MSRPSGWNWLLNPLGAALGYGAAVGAEGFQSGYQAAQEKEDGYARAVGAGYQGSFEQYSQEADAVILGAQASAARLGAQPDLVARSLGLSSEDPTTNAILGGVRLLTVVAVVVGGGWFVLQVLDRTTAKKR